MNEGYDIEVDCERPLEQEMPNPRNRGSYNDITQSFSLMSSEGEFNDSEDGSQTSLGLTSEHIREEDDPSVLTSMDLRYHPGLKQVCEIPLGGDEKSLATISKKEEESTVKSKPEFQEEIRKIQPIQKEMRIMPINDKGAKKEKTKANGIIVQHKIPKKKEPAPLEDEKTGTCCSKQKILAVMILIVLIITGALIVILVMMTNGDGKNIDYATVAGSTGELTSSTSPTLESDTSSPIHNNETMPPTSLVTEYSTAIDAYSYVLDFLGPVANQELLMDPSTPQGRAFKKIVADNQDTYEGLTRSQVIQTYAVLTLYLSTSPEVWESNFPSVTGMVDVCSWAEVIECVEDTTTGNMFVETIKLNRMNMDGSIPEEICLLDRLTRLDMSGNNLSGSIPECLNSSNSLKVLYLDGNYLEGTIPQGILLVPTLEELQLSNNYLAGKLDSLIEGTFTGNVYRYGETWRLRRLNLENNMLTGTVPAYFGALGNLQSLTLHGNELQGEINDMVCQRATGSAETEPSLKYLTADCQEVACACCSRCF